jgi:hypothetical protein
MLERTIIVDPMDTVVAIVGLKIVRSIGDVDVVVQGRDC